MASTIGPLGGDRRWRRRHPRRARGAVYRRDGRILRPRTRAARNPAPGRTDDAPRQRPHAGVPDHRHALLDVHERHHRAGAHGVRSSAPTPPLSSSCRRSAPSPRASPPPVAISSQEGARRPRSHPTTSSSPASSAAGSSWSAWPLQRRTAATAERRVVLVGFALPPIIARTALGGVSLGINSLWRYNFSVHGPAYVNVVLLIGWLVAFDKHTATGALTIWVASQYSRSSSSWSWAASGGGGSRATGQYPADARAHLLRGRDRRRRVHQLLQLPHRSAVGRLARGTARRASIRAP